MVMAQLEQQLGAGPNLQSQIGQSIASGQSQLSQLKDKLYQTGGKDLSDDDMPDFRPNSQKTKKFVNTNIS